MKISFNGQIIDADQAVISIHDHGFLYGMGCFETFRTYGRHIFLLEEHLARLKQGCLQLGIPFELSAEALQCIVHELLEANGLEEAYVRCSVSAGPEELGIPADDYTSPNIIVHMKALPRIDEAIYRHGRPLQLLKLRRNTPEGNVRLKSFHFMNNILARREMRQYPWAAGAEGLFLSEAGHIAEGVVSNIFFIWKDMLYTPSVDTGILPGITRQFIIQEARKHGEPVQEGQFPLEALLEAKEIFLTNSVQEIVPVSRIYDEHGCKVWESTYGCGPRTSRWLELYRTVAKGGN